MASSQFAHRILKIKFIGFDGFVRPCVGAPMIGTFAAISFLWSMSRSCADYVQEVAKPCDSLTQLTPTQLINVGYFYHLYFPPPFFSFGGLVRLAASLVVCSFIRLLCC